MNISVKSINEGKKQKEKYDHISGALTLTLSAIILKILGFIYKIPLQNLLTDEGMGYFNTAYTVFSIFYLLCTAGVPKAVTMLITEAGERGRRKDEGRIVSTALLAFFLFSLAITVAFILFASEISEFIGAGKAKFTLIAIAPSIIPVSLSGALRGYLSARLKLGAIAVSQIIDGSGKLVFGLVFARYAYSVGYSSEMISAFTILGVSLGAILGLIYLFIVYKITKRGDKVEQNEPASKRIKLLSRILSISVPITLSSLIMSLCNLIDLGMIMRRLEALGYSQEQAAAIFGNYTTLAVPIYNFVISLIAPISVALLPVVAKCFVNGNPKEANLRIKDSLTLTALMTAPMVLGVFTFSKDILSFLFPSADLELGAPLLSMLIPAAVVMSLLLIVNSVLEARGRFFVPLLSMVVGSLLKITVGFFLLSNEKFGISGAPIGTVLSYSVALIISLFALVRDKEIEIPILKTNVVPYLNSFIAVYATQSISSYRWESVSPFKKLLLTVVVTALIYLILSLLSGVIKIKKFIFRQNKQKTTV